MPEKMQLQVKVTQRLKKYNKGTDTTGIPDNVSEKEFIVTGDEARQILQAAGQTDVLNSIT